MFRKICMSLFAVCLLALPAAALAGEPPAAPTPAPKGKLVFVAMTGPEDVLTLSSSFRHALAAKKSGRLEDVVWLGYGRSVVAFDPTVKVVPEDVRKNAAEARKAGVKLLVCGQALAKWGMDPQKLEPQAEVVANAIDELARLVSEGYQIIRY